MTDSHDGGHEPARPRRQIGRRKPADAASENLVATTDDHSSDLVHSDVDPREEKFAELQVAGLFLLGIAATVFFIVAFFTVSIRRNIGLDSNRALGASLAIALFAVGAAFIVWAKKLLPHEKAIQDRHDFNSPPEEEKEAEDTFLAGVDDMGLGRYKILRRTLLGALGILPLPALVMLRDLGPLPHRALLNTGWKKGTRLVYLDTPQVAVKLGDLSIGGIATVMPEGFTTPADFALAPTMLIRFAPNEIQSTKEANWGVDGHVAYSKICTHAGCPISLYEQQSHNLLCPCHQSTFDMSRDAKVVFGPAARPLPQLRIYVDSDGYFRAAGPYSQAVGPSFWERR